MTTGGKQLKPKPRPVREVAVGFTETHVVLEFIEVGGVNRRALVPPAMAREIASELTMGAEKVEQAQEAAES